MDTAKAEILCVGSELLAGKLNTHTPYLCQKLGEAGLKVLKESTVTDSIQEIQEAVCDALQRAKVLIVCGGLGPTFDDITREGAAAALGLRLIYRPALYAKIRRQFSRYRTSLPPCNKRQCFILQGARVLPNPLGSAPGQMLVFSGPEKKVVALLPGPFSELKPMLERYVLPLLRRTYSRYGVARHALMRFCGIGESAVDDRLKALLRVRQPGLEYTLLAYSGFVDLHVSVRQGSARKAGDRLQKIKHLIRAPMRNHLYGFDGDTLEAVLGRRLRRLGWRLATAESCTGGILSESLTSVPGSSKYFLGGLVAYDNALKKSGLGVRHATLMKGGAVSQACAQEMAEGARTRYGAHVGVSITGIAGPGGGSSSKPVGLTYIGIALPHRTVVRRFLFHGDRAQVRQKAAVAALYLLWRQL